MDNVVVYDILEDEYYNVSETAGNSFYVKQGGLVNIVAKFGTEEEAKIYADEKNKARKRR